jgi:hypothetical protein
MFLDVKITFLDVWQKRNFAFVGKLWVFKKKRTPKDRKL